MKRCSTCQLNKPRRAFARKPSASDGLNYNCRECASTYWRVHHYKLSQFEFNQLAEAQGWVCAICKGVNPSSDRTFLVVDHCHLSDVVRGLLCNRCNRAIGLFHDRADLLEVAAKYLSHPPTQKAPEL